VGGAFIVGDRLLTTITLVKFFIGVTVQVHILKHVFAMGYTTYLLHLLPGRVLLSPKPSKVFLLSLSFNIKSVYALDNPFSLFLWFTEIKEDEMGGVCSAYREDDKCARTFDWRALREETTRKT
jgi:hypothetical protein